jgi:hypothetical protein
MSFDIFLISQNVIDFLYGASFSMCLVKWKQQGYSVLVGDLLDRGKAVTCQIYEIGPGICPDAFSQQVILADLIANGALVVVVLPNIL